MDATCRSIKGDAMSTPFKKRRKTKRHAAAHDEASSGAGSVQGIREHALATLPRSLRSLARQGPPAGPPGPGSVQGIRTKVQTDSRKMRGFYVTQRGPIKKRPRKPTKKATPRVPAGDGSTGKKRPLKLTKGVTPRVPDNDSTSGRKRPLKLVKGVTPRVPEGGGTSGKERTERMEIEDASPRRVTRDEPQILSLGTLRANPSLEQHLVFTGLEHFAAFTHGNPALATELLDALGDPRSADHELAQRWIARVRRVVPDTLPELVAHAPGSPALWRVIGKALRLTETDPAGILAEMYWTKSRNPRWNRQFDGNAMAGALRDKNLSQGFDDALAAYTARQKLPDSAPVQLASIRNDAHHRDWTNTRRAATGYLNGLAKRLRSGITEEHGTHEQWLAELARDPAQSGDRALDRLANAIAVLNGTRKCVAVLRNGREIGICANKADNSMAQDMEDLLAASRAVGSEAERRTQAVVDKMAKRHQVAGPNLTPVEFKRGEIRLRKAIAFLRTLEEQHGRIRVVPYSAGVQDEVHAEMHALTIAADHPGAVLGVSRLCCLKCWQTLNEVKPDIFRRTVATHATAYPWPFPSLLADAPSLAALFRIDLHATYQNGSLEQRMQQAINTPSLWSALINAYSYVTGAGSRTDYASSQEEPEGPPPSPRPPDDEAEGEAEYDVYLGSDAVLTRAEQQAARGDADVPRPAAKTKRDQPRPGGLGGSTTIARRTYAGPVPGRPEPTRTAKRRRVDTAPPAKEKPHGQDSLT
jgi:hypothetical protein